MLRQFLIASLLMTFAPLVVAVPILYQYTSSVSGDYDPAINMPVDSADRIFATGTAVTATFLYDADVSISSTLPPGTLPGYGALSIYPGAFSGFNGSIGGNVITDTGTGSGFVADSTNSSLYDGVFLTSSATGLSSLTIGDFNLVGFTLFAVGPWDFLDSGALPDPLVMGSNNTGLNFRFEDSTGYRQLVQTHNGTFVAVPESETLMLLALGLVVLAAGRLRLILRGARP